MLICGIGQVLLLEAGAARVLRDRVGGLRGDLHQPARARVRGLVAEARLLVDDRRDQRRVEVLVGGLLADDVVVAERERGQLAHRLRRRGRSRSPRTSRPSTTATATAASRRRLIRARVGRRATLRRAAWELMGAVRRVSQVRGTVSPSTPRGYRRCGPRSPLAPPFPPARAGGRCAPPPTRARARRARSARTSSSATTAIVASNACSIPDSNRSGTSTTAARGAGSSASTSCLHSATRCPTRGHSSPSSQLRASSSPKTRSAISERSSAPPGATSSPSRPTTMSRSSSLASSSWTTASVESVAAPSSPSARSASDLPAPGRR